jgi:hypothetical protein
VLDIGPAEVSVGGGVLAILLGGYRRVWCWYYQLTDERTVRLEQIAALRLEIEKVERREADWRTIALQQRGLLATAVETVVAARHGE